MWKDAADPLRSCPDCGREEATRFEHCPHCGASYFARSQAERRRRRRLTVMTGVVLAVACAAVATAMIHEADDREARQEVEYREAVARKKAELVRVQAPHRGRAPDLAPSPGATTAELLEARRALFERVEETITRDARARAEAGELDGPISNTECGPLERRPDAVPAHEAVTIALGRYDCVAVKRDVRQRGKSVGRLGHPFVATLNFETFSYVWCRNTPAQSEAGRALIFVRLERACLAAKGRAVGTGYIDVPVG